MTEPSPTRPLPGPPRPGPGPAGNRVVDDPSTGGAVDGGPTPAAEPPPTAEDRAAGAASFEDLEQRPVADHVGVFEAEHARLQRELGTIDQL
jgi:hypothetical protein